MKKEYVVSVTGLGYVGLAVAFAFAKKYKTIGFDIDQTRISELEKGFDRNLELSDADLKATKINLSSNPEILKQANFHIIAVPTPTGNAHRPVFTALHSATQELGRHIKKGDIVVFESTVYPGLTEDVCLPTLEKLSGMKCGVDFQIGYSPERINPGDRKRPFSKIRKVVSSNDKETLEIVAEMYQSVLEQPVHRAPSIKVAETAKVIENTQRDVNISLVNELAKICDLLNIETKDVLNAAKTKWNFLDFQPGLVGGHCISVDPYYLAYKAELLGLIPEVILSGRRTNEGMSQFIAQKCIKKLIQTGCDITKAQVAILGFTYKENCPDIRDTKVADMIKELKEYNIDPKIYDPFADPNEVLHEYGYSIQSTLPAAPVNCLIIAVKHEAYCSLDAYQLQKMIVPGGVLFDVKNICDTDSLRKLGVHAYCL